MTPELLTPRQQAPRRPRLTAEVVPVAALSAGDRAAAYALFESVYTGADRARFEEDLAAKDQVIVLRDPDGALRGFSTVELRLQETALGSTWVLFSGDTAIDPLFWGTKSLQRSFAGLLLRTKLRHPFTPVVWLLISKGFRTYLLMNNYFRRAIPMRSRHDRRLGPVLDALAVERFPGRFDPVARVVRNDGAHEHVEESLAQIPEQLVRSNPQVARFVTLNPGHLAGDELACLALVGLDDIWRLGWRTTVARLCSALGIKQRRRG